MLDKQEQLKIEALRIASGLHSSPTANPIAATSNKPIDVVATAEAIYDWLKKDKTSA